MASCLTPPCQLELLALKAASSDRPSVVAVGCSLMGSLVDFQSQHHDSRQSFLLCSSLCVAMKCSPCFSQMKLSASSAQGGVFV